MTKKEHKLDEGRIEGIIKDLKRFKTLEGLKRFLIVEIEFTNETIFQEKNC